MKQEKGVWSSLEITFISGYTPITIETNEIIDNGNSYCFETKEKFRNKEVIFKYTIPKKKVLKVEVK